MQIYPFLRVLSGHLNILNEKSHADVVFVGEAQAQRGDAEVRQVGGEGDGLVGEGGQGLELLKGEVGREFLVGL